VALFAGCLQGFVYPEQLRACVEVLGAQQVAVDLPMEQSCCGLPLQMMGGRQGSRSHRIVTLCVSCASLFKHGYAKLVVDDPRLVAMAAAFSHKIIDFSSLAHDVLRLQSGSSQRRGERAAYHSPFHLCRGFGLLFALH
jgi:Fe-S oxidoreductase